MTIAVRPATERDIDALVALHRVVHDLHVAAAPWFFQSPTVDAAVTIFRSKLESTEVHLLVADVDGEIVGYTSAVSRERPENTIVLARRHLELDELCVAPQHRRLGVARALVERVLEEARLLGGVDVELSTWAFNREARATFEALGFQPMVTRFRSGTKRLA